MSCCAFLSVFSLSLLFICIFFFFKQKTAYEMRISDWSSDVCSSDLDSDENAAASDAQAARRRDYGRWPWASQWCRTRTPPKADDRRQHARSGSPRATPRRAQAEIGSASCRERVCQYV